MKLKSYLTMARPSHWFKNVFVLPGAIVAWSIARPFSERVALHLLCGLVAVCLAASANYVLNEWVDRDSDRFHPVKRRRPSVQGGTTFFGVATTYLLLAVFADVLGWEISKPFGIVLGLFLLMGWVYNLPPVRTKDRAYLDVLSESINNPLRFLLGWYIVVSAPFPPSSLLIAYWMGGAYLMGIKRYSEYRFIHDPETARLYRRSFATYTESSLMISSIFYGLLTAFLAGVFMIKYRIELMVAMPFHALMFAWYFSIGLKPDSAAQHPERIYRERAFLFFTVFVAILTVALSFVQIPSFERFLDPVLPVGASATR